MCSNISTETTRSKRRSSSKHVDVGGDDLDVARARRASIHSRWRPSSRPRVIRAPGTARRAKRVSEPQPQPRSRTPSPSSMPARSQVRSSIASSAAARVSTPSARGRSCTSAAARGRAGRTRRDLVVLLVRLLDLSAIGARRSSSHEARCLRGRALRPLAARRIAQLARMPAGAADRGRVRGDHAVEERHARASRGNQGTKTLVSRW